MKGFKHLFCNVPINIVIGCLVYYYLLQSTIVIVGVYLAIIFGNISDMDLTIEKGYHRHFLFHSIIWIVGMWLFALQYPFVMLILSFCMLGTGLHCLEDINIIKGTMGYYCIAYGITITGKIKRLSGFWSTVWLFGNFLLSVVIFGITLYWVI